MRIAVLGLGNELLKDEGFGIHVVRALSHSNRFPGNVQLVEAGTPGLDILTLLEGFDKAVVVDIVKMGKEPGHIYELSFKRNWSLKQQLPDMTSFHDLDFVSVLKAGWSSGLDFPNEVFVIGVEPVDYRDWGLDPTPVVKAAIPKVVGMIEKLVGSLVE